MVVGCVEGDGTVIEDPNCVFDFDDEGRVRLLDNVDGAVASNQHIVADAVRLTPVAVPPDGGVPRDMTVIDGDLGAGVDGGPGRRPRSGCGCRVGTTSAGTPTFGLLLAGLFLLRVRRRVR